MADPRTRSLLHPVLNEVPWLRVLWIDAPPQASLNQGFLDAFGAGILVDDDGVSMVLYGRICEIRDKNPSPELRFQPSVNRSFDHRQNKLNAVDLPFGRVITVRPSLEAGSGQLFGHNEWPFVCPN
jgi:hypothetical protein